MSGLLYVVGTPIGNLNDLTYRTGKALEEADFLAVEDTRVTIKLLNHLGLKKPMLSYHEHNLEERGAQLIERILSGETCALCCDAGTPAISDPGQILVQQAHEVGIRVVPIPGPSAFVAALSAGGQDTGRFVFEGFLSVNKKQRKERLAFLRAEHRTMIFYEAPHKLQQTLCDLESVFGAQRKLTVARELTKLHEEIFVTSIGEARQKYAETPPRGEFVLLLAGAPESECEQEASDIEQIVALVKQRVREGAALPAACKEAAAGSPFSKSEIYKRVLETEGEQ